MSTPSTKISICSGVPLNSRYEHSIYFDSLGAQSAYFASKVVREYTKVTYCRKSWPLQVEATMSQARTWNYLYFNNGETGKRYYYFITNIEYKNDATVTLTLELDVLQTYMFDYDLMPCFVERQHVGQDTLGAYTLDEGLELGELVDNGYYTFPLTELCVLTLSTFNPNIATSEEPMPALGYLYDGVASGLSLWATDVTDPESFAAWQGQLDALNNVGFSEGILSMWMYPKNFVTLGGEGSWYDDEIFKVVSDISPYMYADLDNFSCGVTVDGYQPQNNKLLCYPFNMLYATNNAGETATYRFERFNGVPKFTLKGSLSPDGAVKLFPREYNGGGSTQSSRDGYEYGITLGGFPSCAWESDTYKLWLAQNQNQHKLTMTSATVAGVAGAVTAAASLATGNVIGAVGGAGAAYGAYQQIQGLMAQKADMAIQPPQARGTFSNTVNVAAKMQTFTLVRKSVSAEYAKRIDNYFTMYGYKLNAIRTPNPAERDTFTYIKTVGCHIKSMLCDEDACKIESIYNNGITWWMDGDNVCQYSIANRPVIN